MESRARLRVQEKSVKTVLMDAELLCAGSA